MVLPYKAIIDHELLDNVVYMGKFDTIAPNTDTNGLIDDHVETYIKLIADKSNVLSDPAVI